MNDIYVSKSAHENLISYLKSRGSVHIVEPSASVTWQVADHPDIYMCRVRNTLLRADAQSLGPDYPRDIPFNAVCTGKYFLHYTRYTDPGLLQHAKDMDMSIVHVKQGYTKCSCVVVDSSAIITADRGIVAACKEDPSAAGLEVLQISEGHVLLHGFSHGFIGGTSGRIGNEIVFNGDLSAHPDCHRIIEFIKDRGLNVKYFTEYPLTDIGSIIEAPCTQST